MKFEKSSFEQIGNSDDYQFNGSLEGRKDGLVEIHYRNYLDSEGMYFILEMDYGADSKVDFFSTEEELFAYLNSNFSS